MSTYLIGRTCFPEEFSTRRKFLAARQAWAEQIKQLVYSNYITLDLLLISAVITCLLAFAINAFMRTEKTISLIIWVVIVQVMALQLFCSLLFYLMRKDTIKKNCLFEVEKYDCGGMRAQMYHYLWVIFLALFAIFFMFTALMFNKINLIISFIQISQKVTCTLKDAKYLPFFGAFFLTIYFFILILTSIFTFSIGEVAVVNAKNIDGGKVKLFQYTYQYVLLLIVVIVSYWILVQFTINLTRYMMGFMITKWFFYRHKATIFLPFKEVFMGTLRFHSGSISFYTVVRCVFGWLIDFMDGLSNLLAKNPSSSVSSFF